MKLFFLFIMKQMCDLNKKNVKMREWRIKYKLCPECSDENLYKKMEKNIK